MYKRQSEKKSPSDLNSYGSIRSNQNTGICSYRLISLILIWKAPVFWFYRMLPYEFKSEGDFFSDMRRSEVMNAGADYVEVDVTKGDDGKVIHCMLTIPYCLLYTSRCV